APRRAGRTRLVRTRRAPCRAACACASRDPPSARRGRCSPPAGAASRRASRLVLHVAARVRAFTLELLLEQPRLALLVLDALFDLGHADLRGHALCVHGGNTGQSPCREAYQANHLW